MKHFRITNGRPKVMCGELEINDAGKFYSFTINHEEAKELMRQIQDCLPMEVCESSDIKFLNERLRKAEAKIVSLEQDLSGHAGQHMKDNHQEKVRNLERKVERLEASNEQRKKDIKHAWNVCEDIKTLNDSTARMLLRFSSELNTHLCNHYSGNYDSQHR